MDYRLIILPPLLALLLGSCSEEEIRTYRVASEEPEPVEAAATAAPSSRPDDLSVRWHAPAGWEELPVGQFQLALYQVGSGLKASVSMLPGDAGGIPANVNRWRGQVGLGPLEASELVGEAIPAFEGEGALGFYELLNASGGAEAAGILAGILRLSGETWFFKLIGPAGELEEHRDEFTDFLANLQTKAGSGFGKKGPPPEKAADPAKPKIEFEVPEGWTKVEGNPMRVASFRATGEDGFEADIAVVPLPGDAGSVLENVNRWRSQLQLEPLEDEADPEVGSLVANERTKYLVCHMRSEEPVIDEKHHGAISAAILDGDKYTWFLKMTGEARVVEANRKQFEAFVDSVSFP